jgi:hypothetical protein
MLKRIRTLLNESVSVMVILEIEPLHIKNSLQPL